VLTKPVSAITLLLDPQAAVAPYDNVSPAHIRALPKASLSLANARKFYLTSTQVYNDKLPVSYNWTYEDVPNVADAELVSKILAELATSKQSLCPEELECGGVYKFTSLAADGYAYCAYRHAGSVTTPPHDCTALYFQTRQKTYLAAFVSPYIGEAFGQFTRGLNCFVKKSAKGPIELKNVANNIIQIIKEGKTGIQLSLAKSSHDIGGAEYLVGLRRLETSNVFPASMNIPPRFLK
jgi:hypothetical protein